MKARHTNPLLFFVLCALALCFPLHAQTAQTGGGRVVLVLPFENRSGQTSLDWVGESFAETFSQRFASSGFYPIDRDDREFALDHLGLPVGFRPSHATAIQIAQTLDAEFVIVGSFTTSGDTMTAQAQVLRVNQLRMTQPIDTSSPLQKILDLENTLAWKCAREMDPRFSIAVGTFLAASQNINLEAYENYIRALATPNEDEKLSRLQAAVKLAPKDTASLLALGKTQHRARMYDEAAATLKRIPRTDPAALEANFYLGLASFNSANYAGAEQAFAFVSTRFPLPEVINNQGVAMARQGKDATPLLQRASSADPQDPDYHFNVAVSMMRKGDVAGARTEIDKALTLRPADSEAIEIKRALAPGGKSDTALIPQERLRRTYSESGVRQAVFQMDQMRSMKMALLPPTERAAQITQAGQDYLTQGLVPEAEREFLDAIEADRNNAAAHAGLALVRERTGNLDDARHEAQMSVELRQTAAAWLTLARIDMAQNKLPAAATDVSNALRLEPRNSAAQAMKQSLAQRGQSVP